MIEDWLKEALGTTYLYVKIVFWKRHLPAHFRPAHALILETQSSSHYHFHCILRIGPLIISFKTLKTPTTSRTHNLIPRLLVQSEPLQHMLIMPTMAAERTCVKQSSGCFVANRTLDHSFVLIVPLSFDNLLNISNTCIVLPHNMVVQLVFREHQEILQRKLSLDDLARSTSTDQVASNELRLRVLKKLGVSLLQYGVSTRCDLADFNRSRCLFPLIKFVAIPFEVED